MLPLDIRKLIIAFSPRVSNRTMCLAALKCDMVRYPYEKYRRAFALRSTVTQVTADVLQKCHRVGCDMPNCAQTIKNKCDLNLDFEMEFENVAPLDLYLWHAF